MTPFHDLGEFLALPRVLGLCLSPDGERLVAVVQTLAGDHKSHRTALWQVDPHGQGAPGRLTRSAAGEGRPAFRPDGSLLFTSARPDPDADEADDKTVRLWRLPADGGEPSIVVDRPGGIEDYVVARDSGTVVFAASELPGADRERADRRKAAGVTATLHESLPIRDWDRQVGPGERRLFALPPEGGTPRDLTSEPGQGLAGQALAVTPDGATVVTGWWRPEPRGERRSELVAIDTATGERRLLAAGDGADFHTPSSRPTDGAWSAYRTGTPPTTSRARRPSGSSRSTAARDATSRLISTGGRPTRHGRRTRAPSTSGRSTTGGTPCSASTSTPARSSG